MKETITIEKEGQIKKIYTARVMGVLGAGLSAGLDMMGNGVKYSNVVGLVVGGAAGYYTGKVADYSTIAINAVTGARNSGVIPGLLCAGLAYGVASGFTGISRGFDSTVDEKVEDVKGWIVDKSESAETVTDSAANLF